MKRRLVLFLAVLLAGAALCLAALPWWLGGVLRVFGGSRGLHFAAYERKGYSRFVLSNVDFVTANTRVRLDRLEAETPLLWLAQRAAGHAPALRGGHWRVDVTERDQPSSTEPSMGMNELRTLLKRIAAELGKWSSRIDLDQGVVAWPGSELHLSGASWSARHFLVDELAFKTIRGRVESEFPSGGPISLSLAVVGVPLRVKAAWAESSVRGDATFDDQTIKLAADFLPHHWLPTHARVAAEDWHLPGSRLGLGDHYREIHGNALIEWQDLVFTINALAEGEPQTKSTPALRATAHAHGDLQQISIDAFELSGPGLKSVLSAPIVFDRKGELKSGPSRFDLAADLAKLGVPDIQGKIEGEITVTSGTSRWPRATYRLHVTDAQTQGFSLPKFEMTGESIGPQIILSRARVELGTDDWLELKGGVDLQKQTVTDSRIEGHLHRPALARWLPSQIGFGLATFGANFSGPYASIVHRGTATLSEVRVPRMHPLKLLLNWTGQSKTLPTFSLQAEAGKGLITSEGALDEKSVTIRQLHMAREKKVFLESDGPSVISWLPTLAVNSLRLVSPSGSLELSGEIGEKGQIRLVGKDARSDWVRDFVEEPEAEWLFELVAFEGNWNNGPMDFSLRGKLALPLSAERAARADFSLHGDAKGIRLDRLQVLQDSVSSVSASGQIPLTLNPAHPPFVHLDETAPLELHAAAEPNGPFWDELADLTGVKVEDPRVNANVTGSWNRPAGKVEVHARALHPDAKRWPQLPEISDLNLRLSADRDALLVEEGSVKIDGQAVTASGRIPTSTEIWQKFAADPQSFDWRKAEGRIEIPDADLAVLARRIPNYLASKGKLQANLTLATGGLLSGELRIKDAASRPLGSLGVIQDIQAEVGFSGQKAEFKNVEARIGGQPVILAGSAELASDGTPRLNLVVRGQNLSVVRQAGLLVRTDLDLTVKTDEKAITRIGGTVRLRDSIFMSDIRSFISSGERSAARRPPYFSVDTPPLNAWELGVEVQGEKFMRMRSAVFNGTVSARFRLEGTLGEPRAIGEVTINEGQVLFPFANFTIDQGSVRLSQENPFEPTLAITGMVRRYDYDLRMEVSGNASDPKLTFTSNPPLESQQLLLMVMAGQVPRNDFAQTDRQRLTGIGTYLGQSIFENFVGGSPGEGRLGITTGEGISDAGKETYTVEYRLNNRWSLVGEYDEYDDYNVGFKWRVLRGEAAHGK